MFQSFEFNKWPDTAPDAGATKLLQSWLDLQEHTYGRKGGEQKSSTSITVGLGQLWDWGLSPGSWEEERDREQTSPDLVVMRSMSGILPCPVWWVMTGSHMLITSKSYNHC